MKQLVLIALILICFTDLFSQDVTPGKIASQQANYQNNSSVDFATGILSYNIPLQSVSQDGYTIPLALAYGASGIKVDEKPGMAGFGWSFNCTATVSRTMRGCAVDEDYEFGLLDHPIPTDPTALAIQKEQINSSKIDGESDIFTINIYGNSASFILNKNGTTIVVKALQQTDLAIQCIYQYPYITGWIITDGNGNIFTFSGALPSVSNVRGSTPGSSYAVSYTSVWYLDKIQLFNNEEINYVYEQQQYAEVGAPFFGGVIAYGDPLQVPNIDNQVLISEIQSLQNSSNAELQNSLASLSQLHNHLTLAQNRMERNAFYSEDSGRVMNWSDYQDVKSAANALENASRQIYSSSSSISDQIRDKLQELYSTVSKGTNPIPWGGGKAFMNKLLSKIQLRNGEIQINYRKNIYTIFDEPFYCYSRIDYVNHGNEVIWSILFDVDHFGFLRGVRVVEGKELLQQGYEFDYFEETGLNSIWDGGTNAVDYWGYYNGQVANNTRIPRLPEYGWSAKNEFNNDVYLPIFHYSGTSGLQYTDVCNRNPDPSKAVARSLKTIRTALGSKISLDFEGNEIYSQDLQKNIPMGGLRIKAITVNDGLKDAITQYKYSFPDLADPAKVKSSGRLNEWQTRGFGWIYFYQNNTKYDSYTYADPYYFGKLYDDNSNNGVLYHYVETVFPDESRIGYKYPEVYSQFFNTLPQSHHTRLDHALMAQVFYDKNGRIVKVIRNKFAFPQESLGDRANEHDKLKNRFAYFESLGSPVLSTFFQIKKEPVHYNLADMESAYPVHTSEYYVKVGSFIGNINPWDQIYLPNYAIRLTSHQEESISYNLLLDAALPLKEQETLEFADYDLAAAYAPGNYVGLPNEKPYLFEHLINFPAASRLRTVTKYTYANNNFIVPSEVNVLNSDNTSTIIRNKYVRDYNLPSSHVISLLKQSNQLNLLIEGQTWRINNSTNVAKFVSSHIKEYEKQTVNSKDYIFPVKDWVINDPAPSAISSFNQTYTTSGPYTAVFWENNQLFKLQATLQWQVINGFSRLVQQSDRTNHPITAILYNPFTGDKILEGEHIAYKNIVAFDHSPFMKHPDYAAFHQFIKPMRGLYLSPATYNELKGMSIPDAFSYFSQPLDMFEFNHLQFAIDVTAAFQAFEAVTPQSNAVFNPFYNYVREVFSLIAEKETAFKIYSALMNYYPNYLLANTNGQFGTVSSVLTNSGIGFSAIWRYLDMITQPATSLFRVDDLHYMYNFHDLIFVRHKNILNYSSWQGNVDYNMSLEGVLNKTHFVNLYLLKNTPDLPVQFEMRVKYGDGSFSAYQTISSNVTERLFMQTVDLQSFSNYQQATDLQFKMSGYNLFWNYNYFAAIPSNITFKTFSYLPNGKSYFSFGNDKRYTEAFYHANDASVVIKNEHRDVVQVLTSALAKPEIANLKWVTVKFINHYPFNNGSTPYIGTMQLRDLISHDGLEPFDLGILPNEIRNIDIPASEYLLDLTASHVFGTLKINGVVVASNALMLDDFDLDVRNMSEVTIEMFP